MDTDARYERPCRWLLAVAAAVHWVAAALVIAERLLIESNGFDAPATQTLVFAVAKALN
jgi:hypothetical protein